MSSLLFIVSIALFSFAYYFYGNFFAKKVVKASDENKTPAHTNYDGIDYVPAPKFVLFGHHFASIAGAAPIVGPAMAVAWGWAPTLVWIIIGNIFIGAIHDYLSLIASVRYKGKSIQYIAQDLLGVRAGKSFAIFIFFLLILVIGAFSSIIAGIFVKIPASATAYILQILIALLLGRLLYKTKLPFWLSSIIGIILLAAAIILSTEIPIKLNYSTWIIIFFFYIIIASSLPVNVLLQPRDYLNSFLLYAGLIAGGIAALFSFKSLSVPAYTKFSAVVISNHSSPLWPTIILVVACGALSGFHSLVASGTSAKQLDKESDALTIGFGAMFSEGLLSTIVVIAIGAFGMIALKDIHIKEVLVNNFSANYSKDFLKYFGNAAGAFSHSYAQMTKSVLGLPYNIMLVLASMWVSAFAMTTLDTTNRLARYIFSELAEPLFETHRKSYNILTNRWFASTVPALIGSYLAFSGSYKLLWPAFSGANQLIASITLFTVAAWIFKKVNKKYTNYVFIPAIVLWITVTSAFIWFSYVIIPGLFVKNVFQGIIIASIVIIELILNVALIFAFIKGFKNEN